MDKFEPCVVKPRPELGNSNYADANAGGSDQHVMVGTAMWELWPFGASGLGRAISSKFLVEVMSVAHFSKRYSGLI